MCVLGPRVELDQRGWFVKYEDLPKKSSAEKTGLKPGQGILVCTKLAELEILKQQSMLVYPHLKAKDEELNNLEL